MRSVYRKVLLVHTIAFFMLLLTWLAGEAIKTEAGTPFVALYYVLHIFPGSVVFILILMEWSAVSQIPLSDVPRSQLANRILHRIYYLILLALPVTGVAVFFDFLASRPFYHVHSILFSLLLILVFVNIVHTMFSKFKN